MNHWHRIGAFALLVTSVALPRTSLLATHAAAPVAPQNAAPADLVLRGGKIVTVDDARPEAQAMAVRGDTIVALGSDQDVQRYIGANTNVTGVLDVVTSLRVTDNAPAPSYATSAWKTSGSWKRPGSRRCAASRSRATPALRSAAPRTLS